ncbi:MAG: VWA domain-containing protein [Candidatus Omnitrophica bacterium]|nr:VWA domain-containing protein [Candidatus Omnitrophota bacterium]
MKKIFIITFILLFLLPLPSRSEDVYSENLVIVMDCSGSMEGHKLMQAKIALKEILKYVPAGTQIGLLSFSRDTGGWNYQLGPRNDEMLINAIDRLKSGGGTPLGEYMRYGAERLLKEKQKQLGYGNYRLLVITDGEASDRELVERYTPDIMAKGINIDLIGVYMNSAHSLSQMVHSYREANDTESLKTAITEVLAEIGDKQDAAATDDAFEIISGLPQEMATGIISAISSTTDKPIGESARAAKIVADRAVLQSTASKKKVQQSNNKDSFFPNMFLFIVGMIIISQIFFKKR